jgi:phospholipid transport system substrate-binding protein
MTLCAAVALAPSLAMAQAPDPAIGAIDTLNAALLASMKAGKGVSSQDRYDKLAPVVSRTFDLPTMTRFAVGQAWTGYAAADQAALIKAFGRLTTANLAHNFSSYDGERFKTDPTAQTRGPDKLVRSQIVPASGAPTELNYRMRQSGDTWKVIDVYYGAVSQLAAQRSDFQSSAVPGGAAGLVKKINAKADGLLGR